MKKIIFVLISLIGLICPIIFAGSQDAGDAAAFLKTGQSVRALGMGKAFTAIADDASASYWNPAGLAQLNKKEFIILPTTNINYFRSEERRVGKECRSRWSPYH